MPTTAISENWLRELVSFEYSPAELAARLVDHGIEIDSIRDIRSALKGFVVARVEAVAPHPNADRLTLCTVVTGSDPALQVACGAPNVAAGQNVAFAPIGTTMPDGSFTIEKRKLRGEVSEGMICSAKELGIGESHEGILVLDPDLEVGTSLAELYGDVIYEVDITPNRGDCLGHLGIAREIRTMNGSRITLPEHSLDESGPPIENDVLIVVDPSSSSTGYVARRISGVSVGPSPAWMQQRLLSLGVRPINNVVDAASYVMFETGHPLHAFDFSKVANGSVIVRTSNPGESTTTLDERERELPDGTIVIADERGPIAIAGIMGGDNSEIDSDTTDVLVESAWFDPGPVRASSRALNLSTDASYRFERGADRGVLRLAADRAAYLIQRLAGGSVHAGVALAGEVEVEHRALPYRPSRAEEILGVQIDSLRQCEILDALGFQPASEVDGVVALQIPSWRSDVTSEIDVVEEIGRVFGYQNIPEKQSRGEFSLAPPDRISGVKNLCRTFLIDNGFSEAVVQYQTDPESASRYATSGPVELMNGLGRDTSFMRSSLLPGLGDIVSRNQRHGRGDLRLFEIGKAFRRSDRADSTIPGIVEMEELAMVLSGSLMPQVWRGEARDADLYDLRGFIARLLGRLGFDAPEFRAEENELWGFAPAALSVHVQGVEIGRVGAFDTWILETREIAGNPVLFVADLGRISQIDLPVRAYVPPGKYPVVIRDLSISVGSDRTSQEIVTVIERATSDLLQSVELFDVYVPGDSGLKSMSYRLRFASTEKTLEEGEIDLEISSVVKELDSELEATLRS